MTLAEAFGFLSPNVPGDAEGNGARDQAAGLILDHLEQVGERVARSRMATRAATPHEIEDAIQVTIERLLRSGARPPGLAEPQVRAYLWTALSRNLASTLRTRPRTLSLDGVPVVDVSAGSHFDPPDRDIVAPDETMDVAELERVFEQDIVARALDSARGSHREDLRRDIEELVSLARGKVTLAVLLAGSRAPEPDLRRLRNALYQRHKRARERLLQAIKESSSAGLVSAELAEMLTRFVSRFLRRCQ